MKLEVKEIQKTFVSHGDSLPALEPLDLSASSGEFVSLIGPSGCGKSTLFNVISGLDLPDAGKVLIDGHEITGQTGHVSYMMQKDLLFPWRTVLDNAIVGAEVRGVPRKKARRRAMELLPAFGLEQFADEYPAKLSGGMRQRVALLRTVMMEQGIWLLDEPFGALDAMTRDRMQEWLLQICETFQPLVLFITHSIDEAVYLSDRVYVLSDRPARIKDEVLIDLPRPRNREWVTQECFLRLKERLLQELYEQG
ncbi:MAG TPA: ABC transporter ATP-binding protein [Bacillales bacterium]|nr:ABC transporter ATP-binding protein [Bacillales bacterium]